MAHRLYNCNGNEGTTGGMQNGCNRRVVGLWNGNGVRVQQEWGSTAVQAGNGNRNGNEARGLWKSFQFFL